MSWKNILFTSPGKLKTKNHQLIYIADDLNEEISIPLEDINSIVLDNPQITITNYLCFEAMEYEINIFTCDKRHKPIGLMTPFYQHSRNTKISLKQIEMSEPFKKRLWQKIIMQKIANQSNVIKKIFNNNELDYYIKNVQSGDRTNVEAQVAKKYWNILFSDFKRHENSTYNHALDYGYAIIRGTLSKYIATSGLIPCFGIHHCNELNAFNLTEDLIEPFRPFVDLIVKTMEIDNKKELTKEDKAFIISILNVQCQFKKEQITIQNACENVCKTFVKAILENDFDKLILPEFIGA